MGRRKTALNGLIFILSAAVVATISLWAVDAFAADQKEVGVEFAWQLRSDYATDGDSATHYKIYMDTAGAVYEDGTPVDNISLATTGTLKPVNYPEDGLSHNYYMRAVNAEGEESGNSNVVVVDPVWITAETPPAAETPEPPNTPDAPRTVTIKIVLNAEEVTVE